MSYPYHAFTNNSPQDADATRTAVLQAIKRRIDQQHPYLGMSFKEIRRENSLRRLQHAGTPSADFVEIEGQRDAEYSRTRDQLENRRQAVLINLERLASRPSNPGDPELLDTLKRTYAERSLQLYAFTKKYRDEKQARLLAEEKRIELEILTMDGLEKEAIFYHDNYHKCLRVIEVLRGENDFLTRAVSALGGTKPPEERAAALNASMQDMLNATEADLERRSLCSSCVHCNPPAHAAPTSEPEDTEDVVLDVAPAPVPAPVLAPVPAPAAAPAAPGVTLL